MWDCECSFCNEIIGEEFNNYFEQYVKDEFAKKGLDSRIVFETENYIVMPMVGPLVPGYLLMLPRHHYASFASIPKEELQEAIELKTKIRDILQKNYNGHCVIYEHGAINKRKKGACCSDHAHLHFAVVDVDVIDAFSEYGFDVREISSFYCLNEQLERNVPYAMREERFNLPRGKDVNYQQLNEYLNWARKFCPTI